MNTKNETPAGELSDELIEAILLTCGYRIKPGLKGLKQYVIDGTRAVIATDRALRQSASPQPPATSRREQQTTGEIMSENEKQSEALMLADVLDLARRPQEGRAAAELRRQHAHIAEIEAQRNELAVLASKLQAQLEAVGAGGVTALMPTSGKVAARKPLTDDAKHDLATNFFAEDWLIDKAISLIDDVESAHGIK